MASLAALEDKMSFFEWKEEYSVGIGRIDRQHMEIVRLMNELFEAIRYGREDGMIKDVFIRLLKKSAAIETLHFLRSWFEDHMMKTDRDYCAYFLERELMEEIDRYLSTRENVYTMKFPYDE